MYHPAHLAYFSGSMRKDEYTVVDIEVMFPFRREAGMRFGTGRTGLIIVSLVRAHI